MARMLMSSNYRVRASVPKELEPVDRIWMIPMFAARDSNSDAGAASGLAKRIRKPWTPQKRMRAIDRLFDHLQAPPEGGMLWMYSTEQVDLIGLRGGVRSNQISES